MSSTITFNGTVLSAWYLRKERPLRPVRVDQASLFGLRGASQIVGELPAVEFDVIVRLVGFSNYQAIETYVTSLLTTFAVPGIEASLVVAGDIAWTEPNCVLRQIQLVPHQGQEGPLPNHLTTPLAPFTDHARLTFAQLA